MFPWSLEIAMETRSVSSEVAQFLSEVAEKSQNTGFCGFTQRRKGFVFPCVSTSLRENKNP